MDYQNIVEQLGLMLKDEPLEARRMLAETMKLQPMRREEPPAAQAIRESLAETVDFAVKRFANRILDKNPNNRLRIARREASTIVGQVCKNRQMIHAMQNPRIFDLCVLSGERAGEQCRRILGAEKQPGKEAILEAIYMATGAPREKAADPSSMAAAVQQAAEYMIFNGPAMKKHWASRSRKKADTERMFLDAMNTATLVAAIVALGSLTARSL